MLSAVLSAEVKNESKSMNQFCVLLTGSLLAVQHFGHPSELGYNCGPGPVAVDA